MRIVKRSLTSVLLGIALLSAGNALAVPVQLVYQSDPQFGNTTFLLSYDSLTDFANANSASSVPTANNFATGGYLAGFAYDGSQYHLVYQSDPQFGNTTFLLSYDSLTDFANANSASSVPTANNFATGGYLAGFTYDGSQYHLVYQSDPQFGNTTFLLSYDSLTDFATANSASSVSTANNFATGGYLAGFTYDGSQYHLVYQSDPQFGNTTFLLSYDSLADFANANSASSVPTANNFATGGYLAGFNATIPGLAAPEPLTLAMLLLGLGGVCISRRRVALAKNGRSS